MSSISSECTMEVAHDPGHACKASKRGRANLLVTDVQYKHALYECLVADPPLLDMRSKLGPRLCAHVKQVEPGHLMAVQKAWMPLINNGCKNLVLQSKKISSALHSLALENSLLIQAGGPLSLIVPVVVIDVKEHIMACAMMMRAFKK